MAHLNFFVCLLVSWLSHATRLRHDLQPFTRVRHFHFRHHKIEYNVAKMADTQIVLAMAVVVLCKRSGRKGRRVQEVRENEWLQRRWEKRVFRWLMKELRLEDELNYRIGLEIVFVFTIEQHLVLLPQWYEAFCLFLRKRYLGCTVSRAINW